MWSMLYVFDMTHVVLRQPICNQSQKSSRREANCLSLQIFQLESQVTGAVSNEI